MRAVEEWLESLGLGKYIQVFADNDIDWRALPHIEAADLQEIGVSLGHRKIILAAISQLRTEELAAGGIAGPIEAGSPAVERHEAGPDIRLLSVLFCDMVGSTALSGRFTPEDMHELISVYQETVAQAIKAYGGYVAKFLGDGVLAYFGWPVAQEDHAERAVHAGLAAVTAVEQLTDPGGAALRSRVGICTGRVVVGDLANGGVLDKGQIAGETPNLAARLQAAAEPGQVLVAESTYRLAHNAFDFRTLGLQSLKGFADGVPAFAATKTREVESRFGAAHGKRLSQFVGRKSELGILVDRWDFAKGGQGQVVMLVGEAGIGKSRLLEALVQRVGAEESELIRLQCSPYHSTSALYPVIQRLGRIAGFATEDDADMRLEKLDRMIALYGEDAARVRPIYAELLSLELSEVSQAMEVSAQQRKEATTNTLVNRPLLAARRAPVLMIVEDAHWIDPSTNELLKEVVSRIHSARICVVVSHRPDWTTDWAANQSHVTTVTIGRMARPQMRELVESIAGPVSERLLDRIAERTDGIPLFVEELTRSILDAGKAATEIVDIPDSLQGLLMARLDRLPVASKEVTQCAAVIGREFDRSLLSEISSQRGPPLDEALRHLLAAQIIVIGGTSNQSFVFRHALVQDTAYQSLLSRTRRQYHEATADAIARLRPDLVRTQPELLARHYSEAKRDDLALPYWRKAGERALERSANFEAVDHFANALSIVEKSVMTGDDHRQSLEVKLYFAEALQRAGRQAAAIANFTQVVDAARRNSDPDLFVRAALGLARAHWMASVSPERSVLLLGEALSMLKSGEDVRRCLILTQLARIQMLLGDHDAAERCHVGAIALARKLNDRNSLFELLINRFLIPRQIASAADAIGWLEELDDLITLAETQSDDAKMRAHTMNVYIGAEFGRRERMDRSVEALSGYGEERQRIQDQWVARHGAAMLAILDGDLAKAEALAGEGLAIGRQAHGDQLEGVYGIQMFTIRREQDRLKEVAPVMRRFLDEHPDETVWLPGFALVAADLGFIDVARRRLRQLADTGFDMPVDAKHSTSLCFVAETASILNEADIAQDIYQRMSVYRHMTVTIGSVTVCYGAASRFLGMLASAMGDIASADAHFEHALAMNATMGSRLWLAHTQADYALSLRQRGMPAAAERAERLWEMAWTTADVLRLDRLKRRLRPSLQ